MKSLIKLFDPIQWVGFILSVLVTYYLLTNGYDDLTSLVLGLVLAALIQGFDMQKRLNDLEDRLTKAYSLNTELSSSDFLLKYIPGLIEDYKSVQASWFDLFGQWADEAIAKCFDAIHEMREGYWIDPMGRTGLRKVSILHNIVKKGGSLKAVAALDAAYWRSAEAKVWLNENAASIKLGAKVTRIFNYPEETLRNMIDIMKTHQDLGVHVYVAPTENVPLELIEDYIIFDDRVVETSERVGQQNRVTITNVEKWVLQFEALFRYSRKLDDVIDELLGISE